MNETLKNLLNRLEAGEVLNWFEVLTALNEVTNLVTLDQRPAAEQELKTVCELNGRVCCD